MVSGDKFDVIIIGAGQSGIPLARALATAGKEIALIERSLLGGTCINYGCTPTKTMVASSTVAETVRRSAPYGVDVDGFKVELARVRERKRTMVESWRTGIESSINQTPKLTLIYGDAKFTGSKTITIALREGGKSQITGETVVINVGASPMIPSIPGLNDVPFLNSTSIMELARIPEHLVIIGGGYISCEFSQMFSRFGSNVTIVQRSGQLLSGQDSDIADCVKKILEDEGIEVLLNASTTSVGAHPNGISVNLIIDGLARQVVGSHLLVATGRSANTKGLGLLSAGIDADERGNIKVNEQLETSAQGVFAVGDVNGGPAFTHISYDDYRIMKRRLVDGDGTASVAGRLVPYTVFLDPQLGCIGLSETEAKKLGRNIKVSKLPMSSVARAVETGQELGFMKAVVDADTDQILGCSILGTEGGELMAMIELAMMGSIPATSLRDGIFAHPTLAESFNNLFATI